MNLIYAIGTDWSTIMKSRKREMRKTLQSVGRPREFKEEDVLDSVMKLFWAQGYEGTGLKDILKATGLAKGSIYKAFENKHNLYLKSLERYEALHVDTAVAALTSSKPPMTRLDDFLSAPLKNISNGGMNKGCFLCNASADRSDSDEETRALVQRGFQKIGRALATAISELKPEWSNDRIQQVAQTMLSVYSGLRIMSRSGLSLATLTNAKKGALGVIE